MSCDLAEDSVIWEGEIPAAFWRFTYYVNTDMIKGDGDDPHCIDEWKWRSRVQSSWLQTKSNWARNLSGISNKAFGSQRSPIGQSCVSLCTLNVVSREL